MSKLFLLITAILLWQSALEAKSAEKSNYVKADIIPSDQLPSSLKSLQELLPGVKDVPNLQLSLPSDFVSIPCSQFSNNIGDSHAFFWGPKETIIKGVKFSNKQLNIKPSTPILHVEISEIIQQTGPTTFNIEEMLKADPNFTTSKFLWDDCPVLSILYQTENGDYAKMIIGLNCDSKTLVVNLIPKTSKDGQFEKNVRVSAKFWVDFIRGPYGTFTFIDENPNFLPENLAVLELPKGEKKKWKTISRTIKKNESIVEFTPVDQTVDSCTELLTVQLIRCPNTDHPNFLDTIINNYQREVMYKFAGYKTDCKIIEKGEKGFISERSLYETFKGAPPECDISTHFIIDGTIQRIGYTKRKEKLTSEEKQEWLSRFKNYVSIQSKEEIKKMPDGISLIDTH